MAKFKCKTSGVIIEFVHPVDIITTRENPAYEEVVEQEAVKEVKTKKTVKEAE